MYKSNSSHEKINKKGIKLVASDETYKGEMSRLEENERPGKENYLKKENSEPAEQINVIAEDEEDEDDGNKIPLPENLRNSEKYEGEPPVLARGNKGYLRNSQEYEEEPSTREWGNTNTKTERSLRKIRENKCNIASTNNGGNILKMPGNLRNSEKYEEEPYARGNTIKALASKLRNSQEYGDNANTREYIPLPENHRRGQPEGKMGPFARPSSTEEYTPVPWNCVTNDNNIKSNNMKVNQQQTTKEPAKTTISGKPAAIKKGKNVVNNIADLKTFLARKKLERAQKISTNIRFQNSSEAHPSQGPQNFKRVNHTHSSGEITRTKISLSLANGKPDIAANRDKNQSRDLGLADRSQMRESEPTTDSDTN